MAEEGNATLADVMPEGLTGRQPLPAEEPASNEPRIDGHGLIQTRATAFLRRPVA